MKVKLFFLGLILCMSTGNALAADVLSVRNVNITPDGKAGLAVQGSFDTNCKGFQFDLEVPAGITVSDAAIGFTGTDHSIALSNPETNVYRFVCSSNSNSMIGTGNIIFATVVLTASGLTADTQLDAKLKAAEFADANNNQVTPTDVAFKVNVNNITILDEEDAVAPVPTGAAVDIKVIRTIKGGEWSTICLPFEMTAAQWKAAFGDDAELHRILAAEGFEKSGDAVKVLFDSQLGSTKKMLKNKPYIILTSDDVSEFTVNAKIATDDSKEDVEDEDENVIGCFQGVYAAGTVIPENNFFLNGGKFWISKGKTTSKAFRAYFKYNDLTTSAPIFMEFVEGNMTGISSVKNDKNGKSFYNLNGQRIANPQKGLYIKDGKKVVIK